MNYVCPQDECTGCSACINICTKQAITIVDSMESYNAIIDNDKCIQCDACHRVCQVNHKLQLTTPIKWVQGWSLCPEQRYKSSSGGAAYEIEKTFIQQNGHVWTCCLRNGIVGFSKINGVDEIGRYIGTKYVKSNPMTVFKEIKEELNHGKVLFIGLPCQVAGLKKYLGNNVPDNLYTVDLICHGTPSPKLFELFLNQYNTSLHSVSDIMFRRKTESGIRFEVFSDKKHITTPGTCDNYTMGFLEGLFYTRNCYECAYAGWNRVSDITLGDSWGSELPTSEKQRGISLIIIQTEKGNKLVNDSNLNLQSVDKDVSIKFNHQLMEPMPYHKQRDRFFSLIRSHSFNYAVMRCLPKFWFKQFIKSILIKAKVHK